MTSGTLHFLLAFGTLHVQLDNFHAKCDTLQVQLELFFHATPWQRRLSGYAVGLATRRDLNYLSTLAGAAAIMVSAVVIVMPLSFLTDMPVIFINTVIACG